MARALVVYYSRTGTTKKAAAAIAEELFADLEEIVDPTPRRGIVGYLRSGFEALLGRSADIEHSRLDPADYDVVVVGTPIWNASLSSPVRSYLERHHDRIQRAAFFCTCGGTGAEHVLDQMERVSGKMPLSVLVLHDRRVAQGAHRQQVQLFAAEVREALATPRPRDARAPIPAPAPPPS